MRSVAANYRCRHGEIDLVMMDGDCLVFVEVRYRGAASYADAMATVDARKQAKLARTASMFLATRSAFADHVTRFDVVGIDSDEDGTYSVEWMRDAFRP